MALISGARVGPYEIVSPLGAGGMGEVYRARDTRLERLVALKILPAPGASPRQIERFHREARAISRVEHPHICTLHDIGQHDGIVFLVMELLEGDSLATRLDQGKVPLERALLIGAEIADALDAAHRQGLIHRDLKPSNVMLTRSGVKLLDFGVAKLREVEVDADAPQRTSTVALTEEGTVVGTLPYMAPEQVEGKEVDGRTDIFALGVVLYEMAAGRRPFTADTRASLAAAILTFDPPPVSSVETLATPGLDRVVRKCLAKDPDERWQTARDLASELRWVAQPHNAHTSRAAGDVAQPQRRTHTRSRATQEPASRQPIHRHRPQLRRLPRALGLGLIGLVIAIAGIVMWFASEQSGVRSSIRLSDPMQVTSGTGAEGWATWSPDSRMLAYASDETGNWDIWVTQVDGGQAVNRTHDHIGRDGSPSWSPDGNQIAFVTNRDGAPAIYVMSPLAGPARKVAGNAFGSPQWSPDGTELAYLVPAQPRTTVEIVSVTSGTVRRVELPATDGLSAMNLKWSPDGRFLAYATGAGVRTLVARVWVLRLTDGHVFPITDGLSNDRDPAWASNSRSLFFVSDRVGTTDLWRQRLDSDGGPTGAPEAVTAGVGARAAEFSRDGRYVAYTTGRLIANLWRIPVRDDRRATWDDAEALTSEQAFIEAVDLSPDGKRLLIGTDRSGNHDVWLMSLESGQLGRVTTDPAADWGPRWSPDGRSVVFYSYRSGNRDVWTMPIEGGPARQITDHPAQDMWPSWSPDGRSVVLASTRGEKVGAYVASVEGGEATLVVEDCQAPEWSPDGRWLSFWRRQLWIASASGTERRQVTNAGILAHRWSPDGSVIYAMRNSDFLAIDPDDGRERLLTDLNGRRGELGQFALTTDGRYLYFAWNEEIADLWVMKLTQEGQ